MLVAAFQIGQASVHDAFGILACLAYIVSGLIAVWHYTTEHSLTLSGKEGVLLGMWSGVVATIVGTALYYLLVALNVLPTKEEAIAEARAEMEAAGVEGAETATQFIELMYGVGGLAIGLVLAVGWGIAGGAIGRAVWKKGGDDGS